MSSVTVYNIITIINSILWGNWPEQIVDRSFVSVVEYSDVQGGWLGVGNINYDPCFADPCNCDYHLLEDSPCIDTGDPNYMAEPNETDLDGKPRLLDGNKDGLAVVDMGAYEYRPSIAVEVKIIPRTINLASKGKWIGCYIWLPEECNVSDIDYNSILLEDEIAPDLFTFDEQEQVAIARFSREEVQAILSIGQVELTITGQLNDGTVFEGKDIIRLTHTGGPKPDKSDEASNPNPADGAADVVTMAVLSWTAASFAQSHDVYFGTSIMPPFVCNQTSTTFEPGTMAFSTTYFWRIDEVNKWGKTTGFLWSFTTGPSPGLAINPSPNNGAAGVDRNADLSWTASSGTISHDVYFGTSNPPPFVCNQTSPTFDPGSMNYGTTYYWRIDEVNIWGITTGQLWSFTTMMSPPPLPPP